MALERSKVIDRDHGYRKVTGRLLAMGNLGVSVGVHEDAGQDLVTRAAVNEFGSDDGHVPERSFLRSTLDENASKYTELLGEGIEAMLDGAAPAVAFRPVSDQVVKDVQAKIRSGVGPPNAPSTVDRKGHGMTLIDTGELHGAIDARVGALK